jgi:hypothetical protein
MHLENPAQRRRLADIVASLPDSKRADVVRRLTKVERAIARMHERDTDLIDGLLRILKSPHPQAERLRQLIKEVVSNA